jgi:hypothetical protein
MCGFFHGHSYNGGFADGKGEFAASGGLIAFGAIKVSLGEN